VNNTQKKQFLDYDDRPEPAPLLNLSPRLSSPSLVLRQPADSRAIAVSAETPYLVHWLQSGGNLDFVVLALCSCILTVLCHQTTVLPANAAVDPSPASAVQPVSVDFAIKAGLFTTAAQSQDIEKELEESKA
jgi:hypothetical protein